MALFKMMIDEKSGVEVKTRKKALKSFSDCFVGMLSLLILFYLTWSLGSELVTWLADKFHLSRVVAVDVGKATPTITKKKKQSNFIFRSQDDGRWFYIACDRGISFR